MESAEPMGTGRKIELTAGRLFLSLFLILTITMFSLVQITTPESLKPVFSGIASQGITGNMTSDQMNSAYSQLALYCNSTNTSTVVLPIGQDSSMVSISCANVRNTTYDHVNEFFPYQIALSPSDEQALYAKLANDCASSGTDSISYPMTSNNNSLENLTVNCSDLNSAKPENLGALFGNVIFDKLYYTDPGCNYPACFFEQKSGLEYFSVFLSAKAHEFYTFIFFVLIGLTLVAAVSVIALGRAWYLIARDVGISLIIAGIPFFGIDVIKLGIPQNLLQTVGPALDSIFKSLTNNFLIILVLGAIFLAAGLIGHKFSKEVK
jgi:hypothetical protein